VLATRRHPWRARGCTPRLRCPDRSGYRSPALFGFHLLAEENGRLRFTAGEGASATVADLIVTPDARRGTLGAGIVHHIAWRTPSDETQVAWQKTLLAAGRSNQAIAGALAMSPVRPSPGRWR